MLLAHEAAVQIEPLIASLALAEATAAVIVHYDRNAPDGQFQVLRTAFASQPKIRFVEDRVKCGWGEFGLVDGVIKGLRLIRDHGIEVDRVYLLSGSCMPVRPIAELSRYLGEHPTTEYIESKPPDWIVGGLRTERYQYRHWFNERKYQWFFYKSVDIQRLLRAQRGFPSGLTARFGSQWWCLTWHTCATILRYTDAHPEHYDFFRTTWIPDELFFQSIVYTLAPGEVSDQTLTYFRFTNQGKPVVLYDDHIAAAMELPFFFARKISPRAHKLQAALLAAASQPDRRVPLPLVGSAAGDLEFTAVVKRQVSSPKAGQMFYGDQMRGDLHSLLRTSGKHFAVLYGPTSVTNIIRQRLTTNPSFTVFGRLFSSSSVDFGPAGSPFEGLDQRDTALRDYDPGMYLVRILNRARALPVFQMIPGENPYIEEKLYASDNSLFVVYRPSELSPVLDHGIGDAWRWLMSRKRDDWLRLFWALSAAELATTQGKLGNLDRWTGGKGLTRAVIDGGIQSVIQHGHVNWINDLLLEASRPVRAIRMGWSVRSDRATKRKGVRPPAVWMEEQHFSPLIRLLVECQSDMIELSPLTILDVLPGAWRPLFEPLLRSVPAANTATRFAARPAMVRRVLRRPRRLPPKTNGQ